MANLQKTGLSDFQLAGTTVSFTRLAGRLSGVHKRSESYVYGSGGGGQVVGNVYSQSPVHVRTMVIVKTDFFVTDDTGRQHPIQVSGPDIPLADGQRVTVVLAGAPGRGAWPAVLANHDTAQWHLLSDRTLAVNLGLIPSDLAAFKGEKKFSWLLLLFILPPAGTCALASNTTGYLMFFVSAVPLFATWRWIKRKEQGRLAVAEQLAKHVGTLGGQVLQGS